MALQKLGGSLQYRDLGPGRATTFQSLGGSLIPEHVSVPIDGRTLRGRSGRPMRRPRTARQAEVLAAVRYAGGNAAEAARLLGITRGRVAKVLASLQD